MGRTQRIMRSVTGVLCCLAAVLAAACGGAAPAASARPAGAPAAPSPRPPGAPATAPSAEPSPAAAPEVVEVCRPAGERAYLATLRCPDGSTPTPHMLGDAGFRTPVRG